MCDLAFGGSKGGSSSGSGHYSSHVQSSNATRKTAMTQRIVSGSNSTVKAFDGVSKK